MAIDRYYRWLKASHGKAVNMLPPFRHAHYYNKFERNGEGLQLTHVSIQAPVPQHTVDSVYMFINIKIKQTKQTNLSETNLLQ